MSNRLGTTITDIAQAHQLEIRHHASSPFYFLHWGFALFHSSLSAYQPWIPGEPLPLLGSFIQHGNIVEDIDGSLAFVDDSEDESDIENDINHSTNLLTKHQKKNLPKRECLCLVEETTGLGETTSISKSNIQKISFSHRLPEVNFQLMRKYLYQPVPWIITLQCCPS